MASQPNHHLHRQMINKIMDYVLGPKVIMIMNKEGKIIECVTSQSVSGMVEFSELPYISKLVSLRHDIADFHSILGGLEVTMNVFKDANTFSSLIDDNSNILMLIIPKTIDPMTVINVIKDVRSIKVSKII